MADFPTEDACSELGCAPPLAGGSARRGWELDAKSWERWECAEWGCQTSATARAMMDGKHPPMRTSFRRNWDRLIQDSVAHPAQAAQEHGASRWKKTIEVVEIADRTKDDSLGGGQGRRHFGKIFRRPGRWNALQGGTDAIGNFAQNFFEVAVAYRRPHLLSGQIGSLLQRFQFPVPSSRNFSANTLILLQPG
jgi:hypothetical protein